MNLQDQRFFIIFRVSVPSAGTYRNRDYAKQKKQKIETSPNKDQSQVTKKHNAFRSLQEDPEFC